MTLALLGMVGIAIHSSRPDEISYHGEKLSGWLDQLDDDAATDGVGWRALPARTPEQIEAVDAIRAMGTNIIPRLMHDLSVNDSKSYKLWLEGQQYFREKILRQRRRYGPGSATPAHHTRWKAALALDALGPAAQTVIPQLASMANKPPASDTSCKEASFILAGMGPAGIAALTNYPPSPNSWRQFCAIWAVAQHPQSCTNLTPWLLDLATNRPPGPAADFAGVLWALGEIHADAAHVVPFLISELGNTNGGSTYSRHLVARALGHYGKEASNAIPALKIMKADPQFEVLAEESLKKINSDSR